MAIARLPAGVLSHLGDYLDDAGLCMHACSERDRWARSAPQRQARKDGQLQFLLLSGVAECASDCDRACELLSSDAIGALGAKEGKNPTRGSTSISAPAAATSRCFAGPWRRSWTGFGL